MNDHDEVDNRLEVFKRVVEYFRDTTLHQFILKYETAFIQCTKENSPEADELLVMLNILKSSSPISANLIKRINDFFKTNAKMRSLVIKFNELKESSKIITMYMHFMDTNNQDHEDAIDGSIEFSSQIILPTLNSQTEVPIDFKLNEFRSTLNNLIGYFTPLKNVLPITEKFSYQNFSCTGKEDKLAAYVKVGKRICADPKFDGSPIHKLYKALKSPLNTVQFLAGISDSSNYPESNDLDMRNMFIALIGPSLTGKTQCAFAMQDLRGLYFALNQTSDLPLVRTQEIYTNFNSLSEMIKYVALKDCKTFKDIFTIESSTVERNMETGTVADDEIIVDDIINEIDVGSSVEITTKRRKLNRMYAEISVNALLNRKSYREVKYFTLGFLMKLVEEGNELFVNEATNGKSWMEFHADRSGDRSEFFFSAMSISEVLEKAKDFEKYFLFLDEFVGHPWAVLVRNLARAVGLGIMVANTNTDIGNLTGYTQANSSGEGKGFSVWSMIVTDFNQMYLIDPQPIESTSNVSTQLSPELSMERKLMNKIDLILGSCSESERIGLGVFFSHLKVELCRTRPGVAEMIISLIQEFEIRIDPLTTLSFLNWLFFSAAKKICMRKSNIGDLALGRLANLGLFLSNSYVTEAEREDKLLLHKKSFLKNHLYYLLNPVDQNDWAFLTFRPSAEGERLKIYKNELLDDWKNDITYFRDSELFAILSCMYILSNYSTLDDIRLGQSIGNNANPDLTTIVNPEASKLDGNELEIVAVISIIDSSHHKVDSMMTSLSGQNGIIFIHNLLNNLISLHVHKARRGNKCDMVISSENLVSTLSSITVPFLFAANCQVPQLLKELTLAQCGVNVGKCRRAADAEKVDVIFDLMLESNEEALGIAECKNWCNAVDVPTIIKAIEKAYKTPNCRLNLIFCNSVKDYFTAQQKLPSKYKVSIYKTSKVDNLITWTPVIERKNSRLTVLLFESSIINQ